jgi:hypothetical protein
MPPPSADVELLQLFALFRNASLSVLYMHPAGALYALAMKDGFLHEPRAVWGRLEDVDQGGPMFVDARFKRSVAVGGWISEAGALCVFGTSECA